MTPRWLRPAVGLVLFAVLVVVAAVVRPAAQAARAPHGGVAPIVATSAVCPSVTGGPSLSTTDMTVADVGPDPADNVTYRPLAPVRGGRRTLAVHPVSVVHQTTPYAAVDVEASGTGSAGTVVSRSSR